MIGDHAVRMRFLGIATMIVAMLGASVGVDAATHGTSTGGASTNGTAGTIHPALQQCNGPAHQCGTPTKCHTFTVKVCGSIGAGPGRPGTAPTSGRPGSSTETGGSGGRGGSGSSAASCHIETFKTC